MAKDCIDQICKQVDVDVYYFDDIVELNFNCPVYRILFSDDIDFEKYEIIHSHTYRPDKYVWKNRKKIKGKMITTVHSDIRKDLMFNYNIAVSLIFRWIWTLFIRSHDKVIVLTNSIMDTYYKHLVPINKLNCIYNGRPTFFEELPVADCDKNLFDKLKKNSVKIIGANASLIKRKGFHHIINVLPYIRDFVFVVVGDGKEMNNLKMLATRLKVHDRCYFLGSKTNAVSYLEYYDIYAQPSVSEGFSLSLIEATMYKRSCICSDIELFREIFTSQEVTFCNPGNRHSLEKAINEAYYKRHEKGQRAYERSSRCYTSEIMGQNYFDLYKSLREIDKSPTEEKTI
jgi:glycosyltransferase involved in cell wall biosynthesis